MKKVSRERVGKVVFLGDLIEQDRMYRNQIFHAYPMSVQIDVVCKVITRHLPRSVKEIHVVTGNHDQIMPYGYNYVNAIKSRMPNTEFHIHPNEWVVNFGKYSVIFTHYIYKHSRGSHYTALTPLLLHYAYSKREEVGYKYMFTAHIHKKLVYIDGIISLPAFVHRPPSIVSFEKAVILFDPEKESFRFITTPPTDFEEILKLNRPMPSYMEEP